MVNEIHLIYAEYIRWDEDERWTIGFTTDEVEAKQIVKRYNDEAERICKACLKPNIGTRIIYEKVR